MFRGLIVFWTQRYMYLQFNDHFTRWTWVSWYQNVFILNFIGAKDDRGGGVHSP